MRKLWIDIETYSEVDLKKSNAYRYSSHPSFLMLMAAWAVDNGPVQVAIGLEEILEIPGLHNPQVTKVAHNAAFERVCFSAVARGQLELEQHEYLPPEDWDCTAALAGMHGYPQKLELLAHALQGEQKDSAGTRLISLFCKPNRKGERNLPEDYPDEWAAFVEYCRQDVVTMRDIAAKLGDWPNEAERAAYLADQRVNDTGILVDVQLAAQAVATADDNRMVQELEISELTGVLNPGSAQQMQAWFLANGVHLPNMQAATITAALLRDDLTPTARRVLELRQELALVAAKKYTAALDRVNEDNRLRGSFQFFGAHTGRWAGRGVQLQNLPSATIQPGEGQPVDTAIASAALDVSLGLGTDAHTLKALVRAMFVGPFTVVDYAAIEARVVAWLAGEEWALQAFRDGRDIYVETAERMGGLTRKEGKVAVLALGYNGGEKSLETMGAGGTKEYRQRLVYQWRDANPNIVELWQLVEQAFRTGNSWAGERLYVEKDGSDRLLRLPSGRAVCYRNVRGRWEENAYGQRVKRLYFASPQTYPTPQGTYGGRLTENVTQAVARDVLAEAIVRLQAAGHTVVGHVHDEILVEGAGPGSVEEVTRIMVQPPTWSEGLPLSAEGFTCPRYRKD